jgi:hypothetical protein
MALRECWPGPGPRPPVVPPLRLGGPVTAQQGPGPQNGIAEIAIPEAGVPETGHAP